MHTALALHLLSRLTQLHTPRSEVETWAQRLPLWQAQLGAATDLPTPRQLRRWQQLSAYWQQAGESLLQHSLKRGLLHPSLVSPLLALGAQLQPPQDLALAADATEPCTALFIRRFDWGEAYGETRPLNLRQLRYIDRFPPLHLSARVADASIVSAGNLALEALSQWLGQKLALDQPFPLWLEAAFGDDAYLVDESASLAFVAGALQQIFEVAEAARAFSGRVRRDSGQIETVQGFDLPYGKLEAAFDAGVRELFVPAQTPLQALPQAGIRLQQLRPGVYSYFLDGAPHDQMQIYLLQDLEQLFDKAFVRTRPVQVLALLQTLPQQLQQSQAGLPGLAAWQQGAQRLRPCLPSLLEPAFEALARQFRQAYELSQAQLEQLAAWQQVHQALQAFVAQTLQLLVAVLGSLALQQGSWPWSRRQGWLQRLQALNYPVPAEQWLSWLQDESVQALVAEALPDLQLPLARLLSFAQVLLASAEPALRPDLTSVWQALRYFLHSLALPELLGPLRLAQVSRNAAGWQGQWLQPSQTRLEASACGALELALPAGMQAPGFVCFAAAAESAAPRVWELPLLQGESFSEHRFLHVLVYAGLSTTTSASEPRTLAPVYLQLGSQHSRICPGACPYLPTTLLALRRELSPVYRPEQLDSGADSETQFCAQGQCLDVQLTLSNLTHWPVCELQFQEQLPAGLNLKQGNLRWTGQLEAQQSVVLHYTLAAEQVGDYVFAEPELQYVLPAAYAEAYAATHADGSTAVATTSPRLYVVPDTVPELRWQVLQQPETVRTREPFVLRLRLANTSAQPALALHWQDPPRWPAALQRIGPEPQLPECLPPYASLELSWTLAAQLPTQTQWPELALAYAGQAGQATAQVAFWPAQTLQIVLNRDLPPQALQAAWHWLEQQWLLPQLRGVYLWGKPGLGQTELLTGWQPELIRLELQADPYLALPLSALRNLAQHVLALLGAELSPEAESARQAVKTFLAAQLQSSLQPQLEPQHLPSLFQALLQLLETLPAAGQRLLLVVPELAGLDAESLSYLRFVCFQGSPRLFLLLAGSEPDLPPALRVPGLAVYALQALNLDAVTALLAQIFPGHAFAAELAQRLWQRTQGRPLYLREYLAVLVQQQVLQCVAGRWQQSTEALPLTESLEALVREELQPLLAQAEIFYRAAVLGQHFAAADLQALLPQAAVAAALQAAQALQVLSQAPGTGKYFFTQPLHQQILYQQAGDALPALHLELADYLAAQGRSPEQIAQHYFLAGATEQALPHAWAAGQQAWQQGHLEGARIWLQRLEQALAERTEDQLRWPQLYYLLGELARQTEALPQARSHYQTYLRLAQSGHLLADQARAWLALGAISEQKEALLCLQQGHDLAQQSQQQELIYLACRQLGTYYAQSQSYAAGQAYFYRALGHCEPQSLKHAEVLEQMAYEAIKTGQTQMAEQDLLQSKLIFETAQHLPGLASVYNRLGACCFYQQDLERARYYFGQSQQYYAQLGYRRDRLRTQHNLGLLAEALRDYAEAEQLFTQNLHIATELEDLRLQGFSHNQLASVYLKLRRLEAAQQHLSQAEQALAWATDSRGLAYVALNRGLLGLLQQRWSWAKAALDEAQERFASLQDIMGQDQLSLRLGHYYWLRGELEPAQQHYSRCLASRQVLDARRQDGLERVYHGLGLLAFSQGDWAQAEQQLLRAELILQRTREASHYAMVCHNLMRVYQQQAQDDKARQAEQKRNVLMGIDPHGISRDLPRARSVYAMLD